MNKEFTCHFWYKRRPIDRRQLNLIVHKMEESVAEEPLDRKQDDISKVTTLLSKYLGVETLVTNAIRIGQKGTKPRLLKVSISSLQNKISILRGKKNLKNRTCESSLYYSRLYTLGAKEK